MARITSLTEIFTPGVDDVEDLDAPGRSTSVKIRSAHRGFPHYAPRGGIISTGAAIIATTQDNAVLAFGTGNLSIGAWVRAADWTPATSRVICHKVTGGVGVNFYLRDAGALRVVLGSTEYIASVTMPFADETWVFVVVTLDRAGNATFYANGAALGTAQSIAAQSAVSLTSTAQLNWGGFSGSTNAWVGTFGEAWIVSGILTATQIADIYRAGSIAPFAASFTFFARPDFAQGYGPILKDLAGLGQCALLGTSGLSHAVPRSNPGVPRRAPQTALSFTAQTNQKASATLGSQDPAAGEFSLWIDVLNLNLSPGQTGFIYLTPSNPGFGAQTFEVMQESDANLTIRFSAATSSDYIQLKMSSFGTRFNGERFVLVITRSGATRKVYLGYKGDFFDITYLFVESTAGTPPAWSATVTGTYLLIAARSASDVGTLNVFDARLANVAFSETQLRAEYERGEPGTEWRGASKTAFYTSDFSAGVNGWNNQTNETYTGNIDADADSAGVPPSNDWLKGVRSATGAFASYRAMSFAKGAYYRITGQVFVPSGSPFTTLKIGQNAGLASATAITLVPGSIVSFSVVTGPISNTDMGWNVDPSAASGNAVYFKNVVVVLLGYTARLRTDTAGGLTALNGSKSASNDSTDFIVTNSTISPDGRTQIIRATTNTNGNQQLLGAQVIDTSRKWRQRSWNYNCASGTPTVSLGNASAGTQYVNAMTAATGLNEVTLATRIPATGNLWCASNSTAQLDHVVILDLVE